MIFNWKAGNPLVHCYWNVTHARTRTPDLGICTLFQWLPVCSCGSQHPWGYFFAPDASLSGWGCLRKSGFHRESDRKGLEAWNGAQAVCLSRQRSVGLQENCTKSSCYEVYTKNSNTWTVMRSHKTITEYLFQFYFSRTYVKKHDELKPKK